MLSSSVQLCVLTQLSSIYLSVHQSIDQSSDYDKNPFLFNRSIDRQYQQLRRLNGRPPFLWNLQQGLVSPLQDSRLGLHQSFPGQSPPLLALPTDSLLTNSFLSYCQVFTRANHIYWGKNVMMAEGVCGVQDAATDLGLSRYDVRYVFSQVGLSCSRTETVRL